MIEKQPQLGDLVKHKITNFTGIFIELALWNNNCQRCSILPNKLKNGNIYDSKFFDIQELEVIEKNPLKFKIPNYILGTFIGDLVKVKITGYTGVVVVEDITIRNQHEVGVLSQELEEDFPREIIYTSIDCIEVVTPKLFTFPARIAVSTESSGGPMPDRKSQLFTTKLI